MKYKDERTIVVVRSDNHPWYKEDNCWKCSTESEAANLAEWLKYLLKRANVEIVNDKEWQEIPWKVEI